MSRYFHRLGAVALLLAVGCSQAATPIQTAGLPSPSPGARAVTEQPRTWLAFGDSITEDAFRDPIVWQTAFATVAPRPINAGMRGATTAYALSKLDETLRAHPGLRYAGVAFGTNDAYMSMPVETFKANLRTLAERLQAQGITPVLATVPYSPDPEMPDLGPYNRAIAELERDLGLPAGPDLYGWFRAHPEQVSADQIHMTNEGSQAIQRLWAEVARGLTW